MPASAQGLHTIRTRAVTRRVRVAPGRMWWVCLVLIPLLLGGAATVFHAHSVAGNLRHRVDMKLLGSGWNSVTVTVSGRDVTAHVPATVKRDAVARVIHSVEGVRNVQVTR